MRDKADSEATNEDNSVFDYDKRKREIGNQIRLQREREVAKILQNRKLPPEKPFITAFFRPFTNKMFRQTMLTVLSIGTIPIAALIYGGPQGYALFKTGIAEAGGEAAAIFLVCEVIGVVSASFWLSLLACNMFAFFSATSSGDDELEFEPDYSYISGLFLLGRSVLVSIFAIMPGYAIWIVLHMFFLDAGGAALTWNSVFNPVAPPAFDEEGEQISGGISMLFISLCLISHWLVYPIVFLSMCEDVGYLIGPNTYRSLSTVPKTWKEFYAFSIPPVAIFAFFVYSYFLDGFFQETHFSNGVQFISYLIFGTLAWFIYFRILGRLAWVLENSVEKETA